MNIDIDSKLPLFSDRRNRELRLPYSSLARFPSLVISIDFVDYILARNFLQTVESWHSVLEKSVEPKLIGKIRDVDFSWPLLFRFFSRLGVVLFILVFAIFSQQRNYNIKSISYLFCLLTMLWALSEYVCSLAASFVIERIDTSLLIALILVTDGDKRAFNDIEQKCKNIIPSILIHFVSVISTLFLNVAASFLYTWFTSK